MRIGIKDPHNVEKKKDLIKALGKDQTFWVFDFDKTLTYELVNGRKNPGVIKLLRDGDFLDQNYISQANKLFEYYHPFEWDTALSLIERAKKMDEWRLKHNQLLIASKLQKTDLLAIAQSQELQLRKGSQQLLESLAQDQIPVVIFSASGAGDAILEFMKSNACDFANIFYLLNYFERDSAGYAIATKGPVIHSLNKSEETFKQIPQLQAQVQDKKTAILLGDGLGDAQMLDPNLHEVVLKIWICTHADLAVQEQYLETFDIVLFGDEDLEQINLLYQQLFS